MGGVEVEGRRRDEEWFGSVAVLFLVSQRFETFFRAGDALVKFSTDLNESLWHLNVLAIMCLNYMTYLIFQYKVL